MHSILAENKLEGTGEGEGEKEAESVGEERAKE